MKASNLNEFSIGQINFLITVIEEKRSNLSFKISKASELPESKFKDELIEIYDSEWENLNLWETQLRNALMEIVEMETVKSN